MKSKTPRTDAASIKPIKLFGFKITESGLVTADFARKLERENTMLRVRLRVKLAQYFSKVSNLD
jgi:hypothetical protein